MKKIIFLLSILIYQNCLGQSCSTVTPGTFGNLRTCSLTVNFGPNVIQGSTMFGGNVSFSNITAGTWQGGIISTTYGGTGYNSFSAALAAYGVSTNAISWPDTLTKIMTIKTANDSIISLKNKISTKQSIIATGSTSQYIRGDGSLATFPSTYSFTGSSTQYTKGDGTYQTLNTDNTPEGSTNIYFTTTRARAAFSSGTGISLSSGVISFNGPQSPSAGNAITMGTAFQPNSLGPCHILINGQLTGALGLNETITVAMSSTSGGSYTTVATDVLLIGLLGLSLDRSVASVPVPNGWWVKVTRSGSAAAATYTKWIY